MHKIVRARPRVTNERLPSVISTTLTDSGPWPTNQLHALAPGVSTPEKAMHSRPSDLTTVEEKQETRVR
jgi:hypothetical protein